MIKKIKFIRSLAVFQNFDWDKEVLDGNGKSCEFQDINIIYGRNYSGKTTLSRIFRAMETGEFSDKYNSPSFSILFRNGSSLDQENLKSHNEKIRVFNEDFIRENLRFITNPDDGVEAFAILGEDNNKLEKEIESIEAELGSKEEGEETGLYAQNVRASREFNLSKKTHDEKKEELDKELGKKATDKNIGIKYKSERFGDQNYTRTKLINDISAVLEPSYICLSREKISEYEKLINERNLDFLDSTQFPDLQFLIFSEKAKILVVKKIGQSDKIEELVANAILNKWVHEGKSHYKEKPEQCAFCGSKITEKRWEELERHFDEESERLEVDINVLLGEIEKEKKSLLLELNIKKEFFYSKFHENLDCIVHENKIACKNYNIALDSLIAQLKQRKDNIIVAQSFIQPEDYSNELKEIWRSYEQVKIDSNSFTESLNSEKSNAKAKLRLQEVHDFLVTIGYNKQCIDIEDAHKVALDAKSKLEEISSNIKNKEKLIELKKRELKDEEKGAIRVNQLLNEFFGHDGLLLTAINELDISDAAVKRIKFEVTRDGKKAYHLSEGECSLLAFCYFLAKLDDVDTKNVKPIIWIDDPISSLDGNHIYFLYSLLRAEIVSKNIFSQLFISTHNLEFLKFLRRLGDDENKNREKKNRQYFIINRQYKAATIKLMPTYLKEYATEFNHLFHQIYKCAFYEIDDNYEIFYNFGNNARKFLEIYLYYKYPDMTGGMEKMQRFFEGEEAPSVLIERVNNQYSHLKGALERGSLPIVEPAIKMAAQKIIEMLKKDKDQYESLCKSVGESSLEQS